MEYACSPCGFIGYLWVLWFLVCKLGFYGIKGALDINDLQDYAKKFAVPFLA